MSFPRPTKTVHTDTYAAISPSRPELSKAGQRIVITGGGYGIGRELVFAFAEAGAAEVAILGRKEAQLRETQELSLKKYPQTKVQYFVADVTDEKAMKRAAETFGEWNILHMNAGYLPDKNNVANADIDEWWRGFEINVKGAAVTLQAFLPFKGKNAVVIGVSTGGISFPKPMAVGHSGYLASKMAVINLLEYVAAEEPDVRFTTIHPGGKSVLNHETILLLNKSLVIATAMYDKFDNPDLTTDSGTCNSSLVYLTVTDSFVAQLSSHFSVWVSSPEAEFLRGKFVWINWDVEELKANSKAIQESDIFTTTIAGYPFQPL
jgi:NAD(P)-dependent dehydrogenase (short-subunit alcohol dehydrogenase family)